MITWQKYLLFGIMIFCVFHLIRDILQDLKVNTPVATALTKRITKASRTLWTINNTYVIEISSFGLAAYSLKKKKFIPAGLISILLIVFFALIWLFFWFFL